MKGLLTPQQQFSELYHSTIGDIGQERFNQAVSIWEHKFKMQAPYNSYESFRVAMNYYYKKKKKQKFLHP